MLTASHRPSHDPAIDTFKIEYLIGPCVVLSLVWNYRFTFLEVLWYVRLPSLSSPSSRHLLLCFLPPLPLLHFPHSPCMFALNTVSLFSSRGALQPPAFIVPTSDFTRRSTCFVLSIGCSLLPTKPSLTSLTRSVANSHTGRSQSSWKQSPSCRNYSWCNGQERQRPLRRTTWPHWVSIGAYLASLAMQAGAERMAGGCTF
jgi:hypothetical protein